jgi:hypothetical protein
VVARGGEDRHQPEGVDAEVGVRRRVAVVEVVERARSAAQVADAVAVRVGKLRTKIS